jgi:hypothetical protein
VAGPRAGGDAWAVLVVTAHEHRGGAVAGAGQGQQHSRV